MNIISKISCLSLAVIIGACAPAGYYDSNGVYRSYGQSDSFRNEHAMSGTPSSSDSNHTTVIYERPEYNAHNDYYDGDQRIPQSLLPPHGMCRVWFANRPIENEPAIESCQGIQDRAPEGAYVIYGK